jgi:hypothetical protein
MLSMSTNKKLADALGIEPPRGAKDTAVSIRMNEEDALKLDLLAKQLGVRGRSTVARLILEKFIAEHDPTKGRR